MQTSTQNKSTNPEQIASAAYQLWEQAGKPAGRDMEFWLKAEAQITSAAKAQPVTSRAGDQPAPAVPAKTSAAPASTASLTDLEWKAGRPQIETGSKQSTTPAARPVPVRDKRPSSRPEARPR